MNKNVKQQKRERRHKRIRTKISGTAKRPRLSIFKSNTAIYAQLIDDISGKTLASAKGSNAAKVGTEIAKGAKVKQVVFDRGGYIYTGKVKALADAARKAGLKF
ncbi:MAG: 50S ribosomal protein L18 [Candidatus Zambryskibacteria bacterium]|nr:50S ribosomal protein L18 [Candidatus Zambryskibacteria bacterium]